MCVKVAIINDSNMCSPKDHVLRLDFHFRLKFKPNRRPERDIICSKKFKSVEFAKEWTDRQTLIPSKSPKKKLKALRRRSQFGRSLFLPAADVGGQLC